MKTTKSQLVLQKLGNDADAVKDLVLPEPFPNEEDEAEHLAHVALLARRLQEAILSTIQFETRGA